MRVSVVVDDREPTSLIDAVRDHPDVREAEVVRLPAGDVVVGDVGIERKTLRDYVNSVMGRSGPDLREQVRRMKERYAHAYVLLEGDLADIEGLRTGVSPAAIRGSIASITARHGVPVIPCSDLDRLVDVAIRLGRKHDEPPSSRRLSPGAVTARREPTTKRMYGCIDGIGPELAATLYEAYPTVEALLDASVKELTTIEGIGETRARAIHDAFRSPE